MGLQKFRYVARLDGVAAGLGLGESSPPGSAVLLGRHFLAMFKNKKCHGLSKPLSVCVQLGDGTPALGPDI